jgi:hypothetical protein
VKEMMEENKKLQDKLDVTNCKLKNSQNLINYYKKQEVIGKAIHEKKKLDLKQMSDFAVGSSADPVEAFCQIIEKAASVALPGKHAATKAKMFIDALSSGLIFGGGRSRIVE